jgi:hypothetical protein
LNASGYSLFRFFISFLQNKCTQIVNFLCPLFLGSLTHPFCFQLLDVPAGSVDLID